MNGDTSSSFDLNENSQYFRNDTSFDSNSWIVRPERMKETDNIRLYMEDFERIAQANDWSDERSAIIFKAMLRAGSDELKMFNELSDDVKRSFSKIKIALENKDKANLIENIINLMSIQRNCREPLGQLLERVTNCVKKVYPNFDQSIKNELIRNHFISSLDENLREKLFIATDLPQDVTKVIAKAQNMDSSLEMNSNKRKRQTKVNDTNNTNKTPIQENRTKQGKVTYNGNIVDIQVEDVQHCSSSNYSDDTCNTSKIIKSQRNAWHLLYAGYRYRTNQRTGIHQNWRCCEKGCRGRAQTPREYFDGCRVHIKAEHNHLPKPEEVAKKLVIFRIKNQAISEREKPPSKLVSELTEGLNEGLTATLPSTQSLRTLVTRLRRKNSLEQAENSITSDVLF